ncbi:Granzyme E [Nibea albiflora]|uniref:Granzyme E n=1 Tax=Nibea albiflora TaxID=240163 RepID=A0ACB7EN55_NIBAL|nr:Granzyme E [Nibea albiflora]
MFIRCELAILILALTLDGQVHTEKIIGGHEAAPHSRPYMVLLKGTRKDGSTLICGGFLLNEDFVMTAAHCNPTTVLLGVHDYHNSNGVQRIGVKQVFRHKDYDEPTLKNDIMLLKLKSRVSFNENVKPITFASHDNGCLPESCTVAGWGDTVKNRNNSKRIFSPVLMEADVTLIDNEHCQKEKLYCSEGETGPYVGDSGGPLVCEDGKAYGVVSGGNEKDKIIIDVCHLSSVAELCCDITMFIRCELAILILALTLDGQVHIVAITGGHEAAPHSRPYMALLERIGPNRSRAICGGLILNEDFVMTAAHCNPTTVLLGVHDDHNSNGVQCIQVKHAFRHKDYDEPTLKNDIMLLKGDSGGPLVCEDGKAYGVVSGEKDKIIMYTKIAAYTSWINSTMERHHD